MATEGTGAADVITLPSGGGAVRSLGESFTPDLHTGTGNARVPLALPAGRNGFQPTLDLVYSTGTGNGPFGLGWAIGVPTIARRTSNGVPRYTEADSYTLASVGELVRVGGNGARTRFRPKIESQFARIERRRDGIGTYWEVRTKDGIRSLFGARSGNGGGVIDPHAIVADGRRPFAWHLTETTDVFGNRIEYEYVADRPESAALRSADEANGHTWRGCLLAQVRYIDYTANDGTRFLVTVTFEYEDRPDAFSERRAGFEVRSARRCKRITVATHADPQREQRVRTYELDYIDEAEGGARRPLNNVSLLSGIRVLGYGANTPAAEGRPSQELAPLTFSYASFEPELRRFEAVRGRSLPDRSLATADLELIDVTGDGLPDIVELGAVARFWRNLGKRFDEPTALEATPGGITLADRNVRILDANGDGRADLLAGDQGMYFPLTASRNGHRERGKRYAVTPTVALDDAQLRLVDLDGDGLTDMVRSGSRLECFFNAPSPRDAWKRTRFVQRRRLDVFPNVDFADERIHLADVTGDGLADIVLVRRSSVEYWPSLGHGDWGARITMRDSPRLPAGYLPTHVMLGDVDGDGLADFVFVGDAEVVLYMNQSGNGWSPAVRVPGTPRLAEFDAVQLVDLHGSGMSGVLWSRAARESGRPWMFFLDFVAGLKPYLLDGVDNNIGAQTHVHYRSSTADYLRDERRSDTRWRTSLPFPVHVVARVDVVDEISGVETSTEFRYRHGVWDPDAREFDGFLRVDQVDAQAFSAPAASEDDTARVERRTWFYGTTGDLAPMPGRFGLVGEYWPQDHAEDPLVPGTVAMLRSMDPPARLAALRALRGNVVRQEVYIRDGSPWETRPASVSESRYGIAQVEDNGGLPRLREVASASGPLAPVFFAHVRAKRSSDWERGVDPLTSVTFMDDYTDFGQARLETTVALPRRSLCRARIVTEPTRTVEPDERRMLVKHVRTTYAPPDLTAFPDLYLFDRILETVTIEPLNPQEVAESDPANLVRVLADQRRAAAEARATATSRLLSWNAGEPVPSGYRVVDHTLNRYDGAQFTGRRDGQVGPHGARVKVEKLVMTSGLLGAALGSRRPAYLGGSAQLPTGVPPGFGANLGYTLRSGEPGYFDGYYVDAERVAYDTQPTGAGRGLIVATEDSLRRRKTVEFDSFSVFPTRVRDAVGLELSADYDYRAFQPVRVTDPNGNARCYRFRPCGLLELSWLEARDGRGGTPVKPEVRYEYELRSYERTRRLSQPTPAYVHTIQRLRHASDGAGDAVNEHREYSDGFGRIVQRRTAAESVVFGAESATGGNGGIGLPPSGTPGSAVAHRDNGRVVVGGWQRYDGKGEPIAKFEPFFSSGWGYQPEEEARRGAMVQIRRDGLGRVIALIAPDSTYERLVFGVPLDHAAPDDFVPTPWETHAYDKNDTDAGGSTSSHIEAAPASHRASPTRRIRDALGRLLCTAELGRSATVVTQSTYDGQGRVLSTIDPLGRIASRLRYDLLGRPLAATTIDGGTRTTVIDAPGNVVEARDSRGSVVLSQYDRLNRLTRVWARDQGGSSVTLRQRIEYGDGGTPGQATAARQANRSLNRLGRAARHYDEAGLCEFRGYDFKGNVVEKARRVVSDNALAGGWVADWSSLASGSLDPAEYLVTTEYDALDRPTVLTYPLEAKPRSGSTRRRALVTFTYGPSGGVTSISLDGAPVVERISYDARARRVFVAYGNGLMTRHAYDDHQTSRLVRSRTERFTRAPGTLTWAPTAAPLQDTTYRYDPVGNLVATEERSTGSGVAATAEGRDRLVRRFEYDPLYRLLSATGRACIGTGAPRSATNGPACGWFSGPYAASAPVPSQANAPELTELYAETYDYDPAGNLIRLAYAASSGSWARRYGIDGNAPESWASATTNQTSSMRANGQEFALTYDANGNLRTQNADRRFDWDHADRMVRFRVQAGSTPSVDARYLYGADGSRVKKFVKKGATSPAASAVYIDGVFEHHRWTDGGITKEENWLHVMDDRTRVAVRRVGDRHKDDAGPPMQYHLGDHLGNSELVVRDDGVWINREEFFPYGETSFGGFARKRYRFTGKEREEESALSYHGSRFYAPHLARWTSCDRIADSGSGIGGNVYAYVRGNPLTYRDPHGYQQSGYFEHEEPEKGLFEEAWNRTKADFRSIKEWITGPEDNGIYGPPQPPQPIRPEDLRPKLPPPPRLPTLVWRPEPTQFDRDVAEFKRAVRGVGATVQMSFMATDYLFPAAPYVFLVPGWHRKAAGLSLEEAAAIESASFATARRVATAPPIQLFTPNGVRIGPAFRTLEEAMVARAHPEAHVLRVVHKDANGKVLKQWYEVSEQGIGVGRFGDTEQKALMRVRLEPGQSLEMYGQYAPCTVDYGCHWAMDAVARETGADIIYIYGPHAAELQYVGFEGHKPSSP